MAKEMMSRRSIIEAGALALVAATAVPRAAQASMQKEGRLKSQEIVRKYYAAWDAKEWPSIDRLLADNFTFSSPLDDRIGRSAFKAKCWDSQSEFIDHFDLTQVIGSDNAAFVLYDCHTKNGKTFRNVEYFQLRDNKVIAVECYFGGKSSFPSAVSGDKG